MPAALQVEKRTGMIPLDDVPGWFDWEPFYDQAVAEATDGDTLVEIGVFCAKSLIHLARRVQESGKNIRVVGVDTFQGSPEFAGKVFFNDVPLGQSHPGILIGEAFGALACFGVLNSVTLIVSDSVKAARMFADRSVRMVFCDGDHWEKGFTGDIRAWVPKIVPGGLIGGHDIWTFPDVALVVRREFPGIELRPECTWWETRVD